MNVSQSPMPCQAGETYAVKAFDGTPPYEFALAPSPPNPPGLGLTWQGNTASVSVPASLPPGTLLRVVVTDSSDPPQRITAVNQTA